MNDKAVKTIDPVALAALKPLKIVELFVALIPWINCIAFIAFAGYVRIGLGHWPRPMVESIDLPYAKLLENITDATCSCCLLSFPIWGILLVSRLVMRTAYGLWKPLIIYLLGLLAFHLFETYCPGDFFGWWID